MLSKSKKPNQKAFDESKRAQEMASREKYKK